MGDVVFSVAEIPKVGRPHIIDTGDDLFGTVFVVRVNQQPVQGGLEVPPGSRIDPAAPEWLVAFSNVCTHMGCSVIPTTQEVDLDSSYLAGPCPCHMSTFDLCRGGMTVIGPATEALPQLSLRLTDPDRAIVQLLDWIRGRSVPYGLRYDRTTRNP